MMEVNDLVNENEGGYETPAVETTDSSSLRQKSEMVYTRTINSVIKETADLIGVTGYTGYKEKRTSQDHHQPAKNLTPVYVDYDYLKSLITDLNNKTKIRPVLIAFCGLHDCGKTRAVRHLLKYYVDANPLPTMTPKKYYDPSTPKTVYDPSKASGISYFELVACGFQRLRNLSITEVSKESSCAFSLVSAFSTLIGKGQIPLFSSTCPKSSFGNTQLDQNLRHIYDYLQSRYTPRAPDINQEELDYVKQLTETLPEGIALINIWDLSINKTILLFLSALIGHLYNSHMWLFLDIDRDLDTLDSPPHQVVSQNQAEARTSHQLAPPLPPQRSISVSEGPDLTKWRRPLHYLLRTSRMSQGSKKDKEVKDARENPPCTIFARYCSHSNEKEREISEKMKELKSKIKQGAKHVKVSSLIDPKIEKINLNGGFTDDYSLRLYQKFQQVISETPYEEVPIAWVFLRSLFYYDSASVITKVYLLKLANKCGIDEQSLLDFSKFYTSFGSIFDLTLIDPNYKYVIVKPIGFLRSLDKILHPSEDLIHHNPYLCYGIVSEETSREVFQDNWVAHMDALVTVHLAAKLTGSHINIPDLDQSKDYYYVPLIRKGEQVTAADINALHVITSIDKTHLFKQAFLVSHLLRFFPNIKLQTCTQSNRTILHDHTFNVTITLVHHSPTTKIQISKPHPKVCLLIVQTCHDIASTSRLGGGTTEFKFIIPCTTSQLTTAHSIASSEYHILPMDIRKCPQCVARGREGQEVFVAWNEAIRQQFDTKQSTEPKSPMYQHSNKLSVKDLANIAQEITFICNNNSGKAQDSLCDVLGVNKVQLFGEDLESNILHILMTWKKNQCLELETKQTLARKLLQFGQEINQKQAFVKLAKALDPYSM